MCVCVRERERERQTDRQTDRDRERQRQTERDGDREGHVQLEQTEDVQLYYRCGLIIVRLGVMT